jgi:transcriptional regulator with XRE-family HTH domain
MNANEQLHLLLADIAKTGFSVARVCRSAGIDPSLVSRWKGGRVEPRISSLAKMRAALDELRSSA